MLEDFKNNVQKYYTTIRMDFVLACGIITMKDVYHNNLGGIKMIQERNIGLCILYSILTCGIYGIYWFIKLTDEANYLGGEGGEISGGIAFLLSLVTCGIYTHFWNYKMGKLMYQAQLNAGRPATDNSILYVILGIFGFSIVNHCIIQSDINTLA